MSITFTPLPAGQSVSPLQAAEEIMKAGYPVLFDLVHVLSRSIGLLQAEGSSAGLQQLAEQIHTELDECYRKEKLVLFPYIKKLWKTAQKSETCAPFKHVKVHYTKMLALLSRIKPEVSAGSTAADAICNFEKELIRLQLIKERELFAPYRSCTGCKLI